MIMKENSPKQSRFYKKWTIRRKHRWKYLLRQTTYDVVIWILFGMILLAMGKGFQAGTLPLARIGLPILVIVVAGMIKANFQYNRNEKIYQTYLEDDPGIVLGVIGLESGKEMVWENLTLHLEEENLLTIRNNLFWLNEDHPSEKEMLECMQLLQDDLERLNENSAFAAFTKGKIISLQLFNNIDPSRPIAQRQF